MMSSGRTGSGIHHRACCFLLLLIGLSPGHEKTPEHSLEGLGTLGRFSHMPTQSTHRSGMVVSIPHRLHACVRRRARASQYRRRVSAWIASQYAGSVGSATRSIVGTVTVSPVVRLPAL